MSETFNKNCYTARSSGYKYRTLSTNTGERKRRDSKEDNAFDKKFKELRHEITSRINNQVEKTQQARVYIQDKFEKMDSKINTMLELKNIVQSLRNDLHTAEEKLVDMAEKVEKIEVVAMVGEEYSLQSQKSSIRSSPTIFEEKDTSDITQTMSC